MPLRATDRISRSRSADIQSRRRSDSSGRWQQMRMQWKLENQDAPRGRTSHVSSQPDLQTAAHLETSSKLDVIGRQVETLASRQNETETTANVLLGQLQSMLSSINDQQAALLQHGEEMTDRQKMSEEVAQQLAIQLEWPDRQHAAHLAEQSKLQGYMRECVEEMQRLRITQTVQQETAVHHEVAQQEIVRELHNQASQPRLPLVEVSYVENSHAIPPIAERRRITGNNDIPMVDLNQNDPWKNGREHRGSFPSDPPGERTRFVPMSGTISDPPKFSSDAY